MRRIVRNVKTLILASLSLSLFLVSLSLQASSGQPKRQNPNSLKENTNDLGILNNLVARKIEELKEIKTTVLLMATKTDADRESQMNTNIASEIQRSIEELEAKKIKAQNSPQKMHELISEVISVVYRAKDRRRELQAATSL